MKLHGDIVLMIQPSEVRQKETLVHAELFFGENTAVHALLKYIIRLSSRAWHIDKHLWGEEKAWFKFRKVADRICEKYGLYYDPNPNRSKQSDYLTMKEKAGMPTRYSVAKEAIDYAIDHSKTLKEFQFALKEMGYAYNLSPSRKNTCRQDRAAAFPFR